MSDRLYMYSYMAPYTDIWPPTLRRGPVPCDRQLIIVFRSLCGRWNRGVNKIKIKDNKKDYCREPAWFIPPL